MFGMQRPAIVVKQCFARSHWRVSILWQRPVEAHYPTLHASLRSTLIPAIVRRMLITLASGFPITWFDAFAPRRASPLEDWCSGGNNRDAHELYTHSSTSQEQMSSFCLHELPTTSQHVAKFHIGQVCTVIKCLMFCEHDNCLCSVSMSLAFLTVAKSSNTKWSVSVSISWSFLLSLRLMMRKQERTLARKRTQD